MSNKLLISRHLIGLTALVILCFSSLSQRLFAQDITHTVSIAVPESLETIFKNIVLPPFLEENPDISVSIIPVHQDLYQDLVYPGSEQNLKKYLDATEILVSQADLLFVMPFTLRPDATLAGYFMDLNPLVAGDAQLPSDDFIPAAWQSYQWDGGFWALPTHVTPLVIAYDPAVFDANGLSYPTDQWKLDDFADAARALSKEGRPGMQVNTIDLPVFLRAFVDEGFMDDSLPTRPHLNRPDMAPLLEQWAVLEAEGIVTQGYLEDAPLQLARISMLEDRDLSGVLLLGGQAGLDVLGIALSRGANDVEASYRLAAYLTTAPEMQIVATEGVPARYSTQVNTDESLSLTTEAMQLRDESLLKALPLSEVVLGSYIVHAVMSESSDPLVALENAQLSAEEALATAEGRQEGLIVVVPLQTPVPVEQADEVVIKFALFTGSSNLSNRSDWEKVIEDFVANDPSVDRIDFQFVPPTQGYWDVIPQNECVYGYWANDYPNDQLMPLDPFIATDPTFDMEDVVGNVMEEMKRDEQIFTLPVTIFPYVLRYDREAFEKAGVPQPENTWTVNEFIDTLTQLRDQQGGEPLAFMYNYLTPWEMLMAGYGSPLIDYSTPHPTLKLSDANVVPVVQQVFDLVQQKLVSYAEMTTFFGSGAPNGPNVVLVADYFSIAAMASNTSKYGIVTFPMSDKSVPVSYYTTSGFIFSHAQQPDACYRWLREISRHPELYQGMPAYRSIIESPATQAVYGESAVETFRFMADMMDSPNSVFIRPYGLETGERMFLARAFDRYVLEEADLEAELQHASELIEVYRVCYEESQDTLTCLLEADPTIRDHIEDRILGDR